MDGIIVIGSSGHARVIIDILEKTGKYRIAGLLDRFRSAGETTLGYSVLGREEDIPEIVSQYAVAGGIVAVGDNMIRSRIVSFVAGIAPQFTYISAIHPRATLAREVQIGAGTVVMAGAVINACCAIGRFCIVNTNASLDHDSSMEDFSSLAPGAATGGNVHIGRCSAIGMGAILTGAIKIGEHTVIGAGATVLGDVGDKMVAYGTPARVVRTRLPGEKYL